MRIVIPGALPTASAAPQLAKLLAQQAPALYGWMQTAPYQHEWFDPHVHACTPYEGWQLRQAGFRPAPAQPLGAGLGPLLGGAAVQDGEPVWLAELVHFDVSVAQVTLLDPAVMALQADETALLLASTQPLFEQAGFTVAPLASQRWRIRLPPALAPHTASPSAVAGQPLEGWWRQDAATRPWRKLLNEVQMAWHPHEVNHARTRRGLPAVNGLWLYGGAPAWAMNAASSDLVLTELDAPHRAGDWATWLDRLAAIDTQYIKPFTTASGAPVPATELLLMGRDRYVTLTRQPRSKLLGWLPAPKKNWNTWWSPRV
jgi:hypothetical protein